MTNKAACLVALAVGILTGCGAQQRPASQCYYPQSNSGAAMTTESVDAVVFAQDEHDGPGCIAALSELTREERDLVETYDQLIATSAAGESGSNAALGSAAQPTTPPPQPASTPAAHPETLPTSRPDDALRAGELHSSDFDPCSSAEGFHARICDLSQRICQISTRYPADPELDLRCRDSRARCERAGRNATSCRQ